MFYQTRVSIMELADPVSALVSLTPSESKRVIAKGVAALPEVQRAMQRGLIVVGRGTTNAYVAEELTGETIDNKSHYAAGFIVDGELSATPVVSLIPVVVLRDGTKVAGGRRYRAAFNRLTR